MTCSNCNTTITAEAAFCPHCGTKASPIPSKEPLKGKKLSYKDIDDAEEINRALLGDFMNALRKRILEDHQSPQLEKYLSAFYTSKFNKQFSTASQQLADEILDAQSEQTTIVNVEKLVESRMNGLVDYFIIHNCRALNEIDLPESILKYQNAKLSVIKMPLIIQHFLDLENEEETIYTDFLKMPVDKLKNASQAFLFPPKNEQIWVISDQSIFGSCKEGFAITEFGMYWRAPMEEPARIRFDQIKTIKAEQEWLLVNEQFFNVNPRVNLRMLYFLKKMRELYRED